MPASDYPLACAEHLLSPCLLLYRSSVEHNLTEMIHIAGNPGRLRPHAKTHKCGHIVQLEAARGITKHKCATLNEAVMLAEHGATDVLIAYPQVGPNASYLSTLLNRFPGTKFSIVIDCVDAAQRLEEALSGGASPPSQRLPLGVLLDIDTGMRRTGVQPERALAVAQAVATAPSLELVGLHLYDGQNHQPDLAERQSAVRGLMEPVWELVRTLKSNGLSVQRLVCGGTPTFPVFAGLDVPADLSGVSDGGDGDGLAIELSPGTCVLHDYNYGRDYRDMPTFRPAALLLCRVISKPSENLLTVDLGYKAVSADAPAGRRAYFLELPDAEQIQHSEEHLVLRTVRAKEFSVGDALLAVPAHVCPTVALYSDFHVIGAAGEREDCWPINRGRITQP